MWLSLLNREIGLEISADGCFPHWVLHRGPELFGNGKFWLLLNVPLRTQPLAL